MCLVTTIIVRQASQCLLWCKLVIYHSDNVMSTVWGKLVMATKLATRGLDYVKTPDIEGY